MPVLDCSVKTCYYNDSKKCTLDSISVEGSHADSSEGTACGSFRLRNEDETKNNSQDRHPKEKLAIDCEAVGCTFNSDCECEAKHITIAGSCACACGETECASFEKKM